ncbi:hypothetical protein [Pseudomonas aeruginosa]|uniref:hypothetical protein n=1 Tax=Pseudomonas aeruginosa TaxID=287 RepID=UPI00053EB491|nr:hypothetical protein [Pseudomonas aeruginosa]MCT0357515.1 hypothetical protein [Pseudomonas aeruginosa]MCT0387788.1 hypothetical protein [Pseudomonas aeruginosa]HBO8818593.1 hypothetical protein [Pseudomonas aeruginosa]HCF4746879.1 hypothetical protein [Pseudomonas aeruginosa]HCF4767916.1 hypothetical protein [Pseudomonas aeruginosa]
MQIITDDNINNLIVRLDKCSGLVDAAEKVVSSELLGRIKAQTLAYAGFMTDLANGKLPRFSEPTIQGTHLIEEFCSLIETELGQA